VDKLDVKKTDLALYSGKTGRWDSLCVPRLQFLMIDGQGDPNGPAYAAALSVLYPVAYALKFAAKSRGADFVVPPLEALWWAEDPSAFVRGNRAAWRWTAMLRMPRPVSPDDLTAAHNAARKKLARQPGADPARLADLRLEQMEEGDCLQTLHLGPYTAEAPVLAELHDRLMPERGLTFNGPHHEIYLSDPRKVAPDRLKTLLRQPVRPM
jgi:hypothetical protein